MDEPRLPGADRRRDPSGRVHPLFDLFGLEALPQNEKRRRLVELLLIRRVVGEHELRAP